MANQAASWDFRLALSLPSRMRRAYRGPEPTFELTMGTGQDAFEPLPDGGELVLERGSQGLQHIYVSLRAPIAEGLHLIDVTITSNGRVSSQPESTHLFFR